MWPFSKKKPEEAEISQHIDRIFDKNMDPAREMMEQVWYRNILYFTGEQWIEYFVPQRTFRRKTQNPHLPTPVANIIGDYVRSMNAMVLNKNHTIRVFPNSNSLHDRKAADLSQEILIDMDSANEGDFEDEIEMTCSWMNLCGTGFHRTFPDMEAGKWFVDQDNQIVSIGEVASESLSPFAVRVDPLGSKLKKKRWIGIQTLKPIEWVEDTFHVKVKPDDNDMTVSYQKRLAKLVSNVSPWKSVGVDSAALQMEDEQLCIFKEVEYAPNPQNPEGRYVGKAGGSILFNIERMPIPAIDGKWDYSITDFHYRRVPGRFWSDSGVNDQISPQDRINQIDQDLEMNRRGLGRPYVSMTMDADVRLISKYGQGFLAIEYDPLASEPPRVHNGTALPAEVLAEREIHKTTSEDASGNPKRILSGQAPNSQASGIMVDILREAAEQGHVPDITRFYRAKQRVYRKRLILAQELYSEERILKVRGEGREVTIKAFTGADIRGNTDVRLEPDSKATVTTAGQTAGFTELAKSGAISPETLYQPNIERQILEKYGLKAFNEEKDIDVTRAEQENSIIAESTEDTIQVEKTETGEAFPLVEGIFSTIPNPQDSKNPQVLSEDELFRYDNHQAHYETHRRFVMSEEFQALGGIVQGVLFSHMDAHMQEIQRQEMEAMQAQLEMQAAMEAAGVSGDGNGEGNDETA